MAHTHLTAGERYQIYELRGKGESLTAISAALGRSTSTVSREVRRNMGERGYRPLQAHERCLQRRQQARGGHAVAASTWQLCQGLIRQGCSPEQAAGRCRQAAQGAVSHEWLYQRIYADKRTGGTLWRHLRCQKKRRKRYGSGRNRRGRIPNRVGIEQRCPRVEQRATVGHWEVDCVVGKGHQAALVTMVERKSGYSLVRWVRKKTADSVATAITTALQPLASLVRTLTFDNGLEFARHEQIAAALSAKTYFADPYSSWQRGSNENFNGLLRQYFPKKTCFKGLADSAVAWAQSQLNRRPRKRLAWLTPLEVMLKSAATHAVAIAA